MRLSSPMPRATTSTSAPSASHSSAISLMNEILVARKPFEAYLISSADLDVGDHERHVGQPCSGA